VFAKQLPFQARQNVQSRDMYTELYLSGKTVETWDALGHLGDQVRQEPVYSDAWRVATLTMQRCLNALEQLRDWLLKHGFSFNSDSPICPPVKNTSCLLDELEMRAGPLPLSLKAWWTIVGSIDFRGQFSGWPQYPDALVVYPITGTIGEYFDWKERCDEDGFEEAGPFGLMLSPDRFHKEGESGGPSYRIAVPSPSADAELLFEPHHTTFVNYLRICLKHGGYPGLAVEGRGSLTNELSRFASLLPII
jgi:hypothetical protein